MKYIHFLIGILLLGFIATGCDLSTDESGAVTLSGRVVDLTTNDPIPDALVTATVATPADEATAVSDSTGRFSLDIEVDGPVDVTLTASKDDARVERTIRASTDLDPIRDLSLRLAMTEQVEEPGSPSNILLQSQSANVIGVVESGATEVSRITFQVTDSAGQAIDIDQSVEVRFRLGQEPGGDAFVAPETAMTDNNGEVTANLSSGTQAGVVQVVAEATARDGSTIRSKPVSVTIHGGLPDQEHFSLAPEQFNFAGLTRFGLTNPISVIVGDKFGNPVVPGTAVYFTTDAGVIGGSVQTNQQGRGSVDLTSARPLPLNGGVGVVTAETADENEARISDQIPILFSGRTQVVVSPAVARLGQTYSLTVTDVQNGNPLEAGTTISVTAEGNEVAATGNTNVELDDTAFLDQNGDGDILDPEDIVKGDGITQFTFRAVEDAEPDNPEPSELGAIAININSPNGSFEIVLTPPDEENGGAAASKAAATVHATNDAVVEQRGPQSVTIRAAER